MDRLWTPWRLAYVTEASARAAAASSATPLARSTTEPLVVASRRARAFVILNKFPYNNGHLMVVPHAPRRDGWPISTPTSCTS